MAVSLLAFLSACTVGAEEEVETVQADDRSQDSGDTTANAQVECDSPPAQPEELQTFALTQAPAATAPDVATVEFNTNCGPITVELDGSAAPQTVASFLLLADGGFYQDSPCHRLVDGGTKVLQCGDPTANGRGRPGYSFRL
ncbi:hypothetical protein BH23ACT6_BH23ACT6_27680 [soil metagenome]